MNRDDVRMVNRRGDAHLTREPAPERLILSEFRCEHLERVDPSQRDVRDPVHDPHPAAADQLVDPVPADDGTALQLTPTQLHRLLLATGLFGAPTTNLRRLLLIVVSESIGALGGVKLM